MLAIVEEETTIFESINHDQNTKLRYGGPNGDIRHFLQKEIRLSRQSFTKNSAKSPINDRSFGITSTYSIFNVPSKRPEAKWGQFFEKRKNSKVTRWAMSPLPKNSLSCLLNYESKHTKLNNQEELQCNVEKAKIKTNFRLFSPQKRQNTHQNVEQIRSKIKQLINLKFGPESVNRLRNLKLHTNFSKKQNSLQFKNLKRFQTSGLSFWEC